MDPVDQILAANKARRYTDSQRLGYIEKNSKTWRLTKSEIKVSEISGVRFIKISDVAADFTGAKSLRIEVEVLVPGSDEYRIYTVNYDKCEVMTDGGVSMLVHPESESFVLCSSEGPESETTLPAGVWLPIESNDIGEAESITLTLEFTETIHPIDPKYMPGAMEINFADYGVDLFSLAMAGGGVATVEDVGDLLEAARNAHRIQLVVSVPTLNYIMKSDIISVVKTDTGEIILMSASFITAIETDSGIGKVDVLIQTYPTSSSGAGTAEILVAVEPLTVPRG